MLIELSFHFQRKQGLAAKKGPVKRPPDGKLQSPYGLLPFPYRNILGQHI